MISVKVKASKEKKIEARRGEVYLIRFDPLKKSKFKKVIKNTEIKDPHPAVVISMIPKTRRVVELQRFLLLTLSNPFMKVGKFTLISIIKRGKLCATKWKILIGKE